MASVTLPMGISRISGKVGNMCFRTMKATGRTYMIRLPEGRKTVPNEAELARRELFKKRAQLVSQMQKAGSRLTQKELWKLAEQAL